MTSVESAGTFATAIVATITETGADGRPRWSRPQMRAAVAYVLLPMLPEIEPQLPEVLKHVLGRFIIEHGIDATCVGEALPTAVTQALRDGLPEGLRARVDEIATASFERVAQDRLDAGRNSARQLGLEPPSRPSEMPSSEGTVRASPLARFRLRSD